MALLTPPNAATRLRWPMENLVAALDESGTTNRPGVGPNDDFAVGGLVFDRTDLNHVTAADARIQQHTGKQDYKWRHVNRKGQARSAFGQLFRGPRRVVAYGMYTSGNSFLRERERTWGDSHAMHQGFRESVTSGSLQSFVRYAFPCLACYASSFDTRIAIYMDRRTDMAVITTAWSDYAKLLSAMKVAEPWDFSAYLSFDGTAPPPMRPAIRLAGVVAGSVCEAFRRVGPRVWSVLRRDGYKDGFTKREMEKIILSPAKLPKRATLGITRAEIGMLGSFGARILARSLSFASPDGILGHLRHEGGDRWSVWQLPD